MDDRVDGRATTGDRELTDRVRAIYGHLAATEELPLDREATRWVAEAEAVAADALDVEDDAVVRERVGHVADLLSHVTGTGHASADEHVAEARRLAASVVE